MDADMNNYDLEHVCADHPIMSADAWRGVYRDAWARYYSDAHVETVLRRAVASGINPRKIVDAMTVFSGVVADRGRAPAAIRLCPAQDPDAAPAWAARSSIRSCSIPGGRSTSVRVAGKWAALALRYRAILRRVARRSGRRGLHRRGAAAGGRGRPRRTISSPPTPTRSRTPMARRSARPRRLSEGA